MLSGQADATQVGVSNLSADTSAESSRQLSDRALESPMEEQIHAVPSDAGDLAEGEAKPVTEATATPATAQSAVATESRIERPEGGHCLRSDIGHPSAVLLNVHRPLAKRVPREHPPARSGWLRRWLPSFSRSRNRSGTVTNRRLGTNTEPRFSLSAQHATPE